MAKKNKVLPLEVTFHYENVESYYPAESYRISGNYMILEQGNEEVRIIPLDNVEEVHISKA